MKEKPVRPTEERDLRRYASSTQVRLIIGGLLILLVVGNGLIHWIYGPSALGMSLLCTFAGLAPVILIMIWLWLMEKVVERNRRD